MKKVISLICCLLLFLPIYGCGEKKGSQDYTMKFSFEEIFDPEQYSLSNLPWFTTYEEAYETLKIDELTKDDYKLEETEDSKTLTIYNVKLEGFHYPFTEFITTFAKDQQAEGAFTLQAYGFDMNFKMGGKAIGAMSDWGSEEQEMFQKQEEGWFASMEKIKDKYEEQVGNSDEDNPSPFESLSWEENSEFSNFIQYTFPDKHSEKEIRCTLSPIRIVSQVRASSFPSGF